MPNYVRNIIQFTNYDEQILQKIKEALMSHEYNGAIDFQRLIPNPRTILGVENYSREDALNILYYLSKIEHIAIEPFVYEQFSRVLPDLYKEVTSRDQIANEILLDFLKQINFNIDMERVMSIGDKFIKDNPNSNWYKWNVANWNTKWNATDSKWINAYTLIFDTAWEPPTPIIYKIVELFPVVPFFYMWCDEGMNFAGKAYYDPSCGDIITIDTSNDTKESCDNFYKYCWNIDGSINWWDDENE